MSHESFKRMLEHNLEYSHKLIAMEVENNFVARNELYFNSITNI